MVSHLVEAIEAEARGDFVGPSPTTPIDRDRFPPLDRVGIFQRSPAVTRSSATSRRPEHGGRRQAKRTSPSRRRTMPPDDAIPRAREYATPFKISIRIRRSPRLRRNTQGSSKTISRAVRKPHA